MSCNNNNGCFQVVSSDCILYNGDNVPLLGISKGDTITELEEAIITKLLTVVDGSGVDLSSITSPCDYISSQLVGKDKTLDIIIQLLLNSTCDINTRLSELSTQVNTPTSYDVACLTVATHTTEGVLQAAINEVCALKEQVTSLTEQVENTSITQTVTNNIGNYLLTNITSPGGYGVTKIGSGSSVQIKLYGFVPPLFPIWGYGDLGNFDSSGKGKTGTYMEGWYICNGLNNTIDMRGYSVGGATSIPGIGGIALNPTVDPTYNNDPSFATNILDRKGEVKHLLTINEMPSHNHTATDSGHSHGFSSTVTNPTPELKAGSDIAVQNGSDTTNIGYANITVSSTGGSTKHENRPPTWYGFWIVRL